MKKTENSKMKSSEVEHPPAYLKRIVHRSDRRRAKREIAEEVQSPSSFAKATEDRQSAVHSREAAELADLKGGDACP